MISKYACFVETQTMEEIVVYAFVIMLHPWFVSSQTIYVRLLGRGSMILKYACFVETQTMEEMNNIN